MKKSIIFDLDQTLVDSSLAETERKNRNWSAVYSLIPSFKLYEGMRVVLDTINHNDIEICVITTSPGKYAQMVLRHFNIPYKHLIDYFAVKNRKPHPESFIKAMSLMECDCDAIYSFGDRAIDIEASKASGIKSVGCKWGSDELNLLINSKPDFLIDQPIEILTLLGLEPYYKPEYAF
ncbi:HAD family hydrolase [Mucilaginibacter ginsenosidivorax]|uniref:HAD family hydrolase n=1 Tax=Mucilaginibacter ginsenosidivorax TaxID=862126 RepID=UPI0013155DD0|nr:NIF family HAD-type phosphatase [Mucilaginibacter ginsenosidivorax]